MENGNINYEKEMYDETGVHVDEKFIKDFVHENAAFLASRYMKTAVIFKILFMLISSVVSLGTFIYALYSGFISFIVPVYGFIASMEAYTSKDSYITSKELEELAPDAKINIRSIRITAGICVFVLGQAIYTMQIKNVMQDPYIYFLNGILTSIPVAIAGLSYFFLKMSRKAAEAGLLLASINTEDIEVKKNADGTLDCIIPQNPFKKNKDNR